MHSRWNGIVAVSVALSILSGCAFTQWTDHAFLGSPQDPPSHADREWAAAVILPFAVAGDLITAPVQLIVLLIRGDHGIYARRNAPAYDDRASLGEQQLRPLAGTADGQKLVREVEKRLSERGELPALTAWGLDGRGNLIEVSLTPGQRETLLARAASSGEGVLLATH